MATIGRVTVGSPMVRPVQAAEAEKVLARVRQAMEEGRRAADGLRQSMASERKARARGEIERLKHQINQLAQTAALSPKAAARLLRQMQRQLADAVSEYAKSGDSRPQMGMPPSSAAATASAEPAKADSATPDSATVSPAATVVMTPGQEPPRPPPPPMPPSARRHAAPIRPPPPP